MLFKITLKCLSLRVIFDLLNQVVNVNAMWSFHHRIWHAWDVEVYVFLLNRKVELVRVWRCSITMFERTNFLHCVCTCFHKFHRSIVNIHDAIVFTFHRFHRSIWRTKFSLQPFTNSLSWTRRVFFLQKFPRSITNWIRFGLGWLGRSNLKCFSKWLLNEFSNWLMCNCRTQLIISFSPIEIVFQRDLWWWSRGQILSFIQLFSSFQSFNFWNTMGRKCSLKNNCIRSCLIEC